MMTRRPRCSALWPYSIMSSGVRCADTTRTSWPIASSVSSSAAWRMIGRSLSDPITMPTRASAIALHPVGGEAGALQRLAG